MVEAPSESEPSDSSLIEAARAGNTRCFETLYQRNIGHIYGLCIRMTRNEATASDCAQATFIRAWQKLNSFQGRSAFSTWLHRIAVNEVLSLRRREQRQRQHLEVMANDLEHDQPQTDHGGEDMDLNAAIDTLPEGARHVFVLHMIHGYKHDEVASLLGVAVGTCKAQLHRAKRLLRQRLER